MHLLGDHQRLPRKQRTAVEKFFKKFNTLVLAVQLACFLIDVARVSTANPKTFESSIWSRSRFELHPILEARTSNCSGYTHTQTYLSYPDTTVVISHDNHGIFFARLAADMRWAIIVNAIAFVIGFLNKLAFDLNYYEFSPKFFGAAVLHKEVITVAELLLLAVTIQACDATSNSAAALRSYLRHCGVTGSGTLPFQAPLVAIIVGTGFALFIHVVCMFIHLRMTFTDRQPGPAKA